MYLPAVVSRIKANIGMWCFSFLKSGTSFQFRLLRPDGSVTARYLPDDLYSRETSSLDKGRL